MSERVCVRARDAASVSLHLCVCSLLLLSSSCLYSTVPTSRDPVFHLFDITVNRITHSIRLLPRASVCLFVFQYHCRTVLFFSVYERQWTDLSDVLVRRQTTQWKQTAPGVCVCVCVCVRGCVSGQVGVCVIRAIWF